MSPRLAGSTGNFRVNINKICGGVFKQMWFCRTKVFQGYWPTISVPIAQLPNVLSLPLRRRLRMFEDSWGSLFWRHAPIWATRKTRGVNLSMKYWLFNDGILIFHALFWNHPQITWQLLTLRKKWVFPKIGGKPPKWMVVFSLFLGGGILPPIFGNHPKKTKKKFQPFGAPSAPCGRPREPEKKSHFLEIWIFFQPKCRTIGALNKQGLGNGNRFQPIWP